MIKDTSNMNWHDLKDTEVLYLDIEEMRNLINKGIEKSGSLSKLCLKIKSTQFYNILKNTNEGISVKTLKKFMTYLQMDFNSINRKITEIRKGNICSIKNPKFPISFENTRLGALTGHLMSDGCLYYDKSRKDLIRTKYCSGVKEGIDNFVSDVNEIFGKVHFNIENERNCITIKMGSGVVGEVFGRAGVTIGKKYVINGHIPWVVGKGSRETKRLYLSAVFDDEGSVGKSPYPYVILSRNIHINFTKKEKKILDDYVNCLMTVTSFPTGHITKMIGIGLLRKSLKDKNSKYLLCKILNSKPNILIDESRLLKDEFGINNSVYVISLAQTSNGNYSIKSSLVIRNKKDIIKFCQEIGFSLSEKQIKLKEALDKVGWLEDRDKFIQYADQKKTSI